MKEGLESEGDEEDCKRREKLKRGIEREGREMNEGRSGKRRGRLQKTRAAVERD